MKWFKLTVKYDKDSVDDSERCDMEGELEAIMERYGFAFYASGLNIETNMRDISYEKENTNE